MFVLFFSYIILRADIPSFFTAKKTNILVLKPRNVILKALLIFEQFPSFVFKEIQYFRSRAPKITLQYLCFIYLNNNLFKYFSGARLRRCLVSSKTVEISAKFHEIQKTNHAHDFTMTSNTYRFCCKF